MENNLKILIADENASQRQSLCNELRRYGFTNLEEAANGEEALIKIGRYHPDVAIIDIWLSKLDGIGVLRNSRSLNYAPDKAPSFIIVSMVANQSIFVEAANAGADLCLLKPYNMDSLCQHIRSLVKNRESHVSAPASTATATVTEDAQSPDIETQVTRIIHQIGEIGRASCRERV